MGDLAFLLHADDNNTTTTRRPAVVPQSPASDSSSSSDPTSIPRPVISAPPATTHPSLLVNPNPTSSHSHSQHNSPMLSPVPPPRSTGGSTASPDPEHTVRASASVSGSGTPPQRRTITRPTGFRTSASLIPMDAPTQPRTYLGPSATSRKDLHVVAAQLASTGVGVKNLGKKRSRAAAGLKLEGEDDDSVTPAPNSRTRSLSALIGAGEIEEDELAAESLPTLPDTATLIEKLEDKRRKNALSARKSRQLKKETKDQLEREVARLKGLLEDCERDRDYWRGQAERRGSRSTSDEVEG